MKNDVLNESYVNNKYFFSRGYKNKIVSNNKFYIDLSNYAGSLLLGHNSKIFENSLKLYLKKKISIFAYPNIYALEFAKNIKKLFPNFFKIIYCNSGTEAIIKSLRLSKALNNKKIIINATGSWHGSVDKLLFFPNNKLKPKKLSDGLSDEDKKNLVYVPYNDLINTKKILNKYKKKINCILIEPIQGCLPLNNVKKYLKYLEIFSMQNKCNLIFDEMITGIRISPGSVQKKYGIKPDITTAGKILGGGLPIGVIGISKKVANKIINKKIEVFFGGTFSGNSLSTFVGNETLKYILKNKNIIKRLNDKSLKFQKNINNFIKEKNIDAKVYRFDSILRIVFTKNKTYNRLQRDFLEKKNYNKIKKFRDFLMKEKIYYPSSGIIFLSNQISSGDFNYLINNIKKGLNKYFS